MGPGPTRPLPVLEALLSGAKRWEPGGPPQPSCWKDLPLHGGGGGGCAGAQREAGRRSSQAGTAVL